MLFSRYGTFTGGIDLPDEKSATINESIKPIEGLSRLHVPLSQGMGRPAHLLVGVGQRVVAGQKLAQGQAGSGDIFSPCDATVAGQTSVAVAFPDGLEPVAAVELAELGPIRPVVPMAAVFNWDTASSGALRDRLAEGGLPVHRRPVQSLSGWIDRARQSRCRLVIVNAMENQPCVTADHRLLVEHGAEVVRGLVILARAIEAGELAVVVDGRLTDLYRQLAAAARTYGVHRIALGHKYPIGADALLVKVLARREAAPGKETFCVGAAVIDAATCFAAYRWAACGMPCTGRVVTVAGDCAGRKGNFFVPFGANCLELAGPTDETVIHGGPMVGLRCGADCVVTAGTDAVLAIKVPQRRMPGPCIRCGWCTDHCPARLNVAMLNDVFELGQLRRAETLGASACLGCGVCSYVCPAALPLSQRVRQLKRALVEHRPGRQKGATENQ